MYKINKQTLNNPGIERNFLNLIKGTYENATANIILNGEIPNVFFLGSEIRQRYLLWSLYMHLEYNLERKEVKLSLFTNGIILI